MEPTPELTAFTAARIWPLGSQRGPLAGTAVTVRQGRVEGLVQVAQLPGNLSVQDMGEVDLVPGFIDIQVNGGGGVLFNDDPSQGTIRTIVRAHRRFGTTSLLPTYITDSVTGMAAARRAVDACLKSAEPGVLGVHFEGPFLDDRKTGAHDKGHVREASEADLDALLGGSAGARSPEGVTLVTVSSNRLTESVARRLLSAGALISLGHCNATYGEAAAAFGRGASAVTHLYNAMSPLTSRAPGLVGAAFASDTVCCGLILDGVHVAFGAAKAALQAIGKDRLILVTDAVQPVGAPGLSEFSLGGQRVTLVDGQCVNEEGNLAGSALDMQTAVQNAARHLGLSFEEAVRLATTNPARYLGLEAEIGSLAVGLRADFTVLGAGGVVLGTAVGGRYEPS